MSAAPPRPADPRAIALECPECSRVHEMRTDSQVVELRCTCRTDPRGRGVLLWRASVLAARTTLRNRPSLLGKHR